MAHSSGMGLRRDQPLPLYLSRREKADLRKRAAGAELSMVEYVRCKTFDIPFNLIGGKNPRGRPKAEVAANTPPKEPTV